MCHFIADIHNTQCLPKKIKIFCQRYKFSGFLSHPSSNTLLLILKIFDQFSLKVLCWFFSFKQSLNVGTTQFCIWEKRRNEIAEILGK